MKGISRASRNLERSLDPIFRPRSVAVIGASRRSGQISSQILHNLLDYGFRGMVFPVNPKTDVVRSMKSYPSVLSIPDAIDLAVVVVPRDLVAGIVDECGKKKVRGLIIITAGFSETGPEGKALEDLVGEKGKSYGMRIVGPNCMGVLNTDPRVRLNATFASTAPLRGRVGFMSQSGALGEAILAHAREIHLGFSKFVSMGNSMDISATDLLSSWKDDPSTSLILMYLESFGNPREFTGLARETTRRKPVIAVKAGKTRAGARAVASHTGSLAGQDVAAEALLEQCGIIRVNSVEELFDLAQAFVLQPVPRGNRVAILTNAGGPGIMAADAVEGSNLTMAELSETTRAKLRSFLPPHASTRNPIDMLPNAQPEHYAKALKLLLADPGVDAAIVIFVAPVTTNPLSVVKRIAGLSRRHAKTVLGCFMGRESIFRQWSEIGGRCLPIYLFPESAIGALSAMVKYRQRIEKPPGRVRRFRANKDRAARILGRAHIEGRKHLSLDEAFALLRTYGINVPMYGISGSAAEAAVLAKEIGYPVALKALSPASAHKTDLGLVATGLGDERAVRAAYRQLAEKAVLAAGDGEGRDVLVQKMVTGGRETIAGMVSDPHFGPLMMFGLGGIFVEVLKDVSFRVLPLTDVDARDMIQSLKSYAILRGARGSEEIDIEGIVEYLQRLAQLVTDHPGIGQMEINPLIVGKTVSDFMAVDCRVILS